MSKRQPGLSTHHFLSVVTPAKEKPTPSLRLDLTSKRQPDLSTHRFLSVVTPAKAGVHRWRRDPVCPRRSQPRGPISAVLLVLFTSFAWGATIPAKDSRIVEVTVYPDRAEVIREAKVELPAVIAFFKGIMCNVLVCLSVWLAMGGRSVADKILALLLPISAFVAAGFEHCVANMYFIPLGIIAASMGQVPAAFDASSLTLGGAIHNLVPVTLGNIVGGSILVGLVYYSIYHKTRGTARDVKRAA